MSDRHTLLIVEDDPGFSSYLKRLLRHKDLHILTAHNGQQAIQCLTAKSVDLVLQDIGLPDIDGYQVMDQVHKTRPEALVVVMTGEVSVESAIQALRHGAYDYLRKPFETTELINTVDNALDRIQLERRHKEAQEKLRESEERYHQLFDNESDAVVVFDAETLQFEDANQAALKLFGYSKSEFQKLCVSDISAEKDKAQTVIGGPNDRKTSHKTEALRYLVKKDGNTFPTEISAGAFIAAGRKKVIGAIRDITERHRKEEELRQTKQRLQHILTSNPAVIYSCNPTGDCATTFISNNVENELGYTAENFINNRHFWIDHIHPDDVQFVKAEFAKLVDQGSHVLEYRFQHKDGSYRWMRDDLRLLFGDRSNAVEVVGSWTDITDMKQTEAALRKSEQQFRDLIENSPVCIAIIQNSRVVYENPELKKIYSLSSATNLIKFLDFVHPDDVEKVKQAYERIFSEETDKVEIDFRFHPPAGNGNQSKMLWFQCRGTRFQYRGQDALLLNAVDITEAKQLEHQLLIKNKMLSLGRVAAGIAHEIRNPLTGINTYLYTIEDLCSSERLGAEDMEIIRQIITQIQVASNKIESVIRRVMDFSKPGAPKMVRTDINASLKEAIELSAVTMRKNGIKIETSLATHLPKCYADPQLIEQVVLNLITNAARAMEKSNGNAKVVYIKSSARDNTLSIRVADSGPGVPVELREKIFDPFFTTREDGSGIGLNIAQRIVADHNGTITLGNSRWGGAEFTIELPIERRMNTR
ncbi:MAG: PAS domain S-box protein, partial [Deltaproteobacteria bacterium]|jgi:PAS domain S-box-containing protein|nr:PAS domain S-box protein [Deltaproteobacteria bacterium]